MPKPSVVANGLAVATKGTPHMCFATAPDVCKVPPQAIPTPFPNFVMLSKLGAGMSVQTTYANDPIFIDGALVGPPSEPSHPGTLGGVKSATYKMEATNTMKSGDVFVEGKGVVCFSHTTKQNHGNTVGIVTNAVLLALLLEEFNKKYKQTAKKAEEEEDSGDDNDNQGRDTDGEEDEGEDEDPPDEEEQTNEETECALTPKYLQDADGRKAAKQNILEIVPGKTGETLTAEVEVKDPHAEDHPLWQVGGRAAKTEKGKNKITFRAYRWGGLASGLGSDAGEVVGGLAGGSKGGKIGGAVGTFAEVIITFNASPDEYPVNVQACKGEQKWTVKAYPWGKASFTLDLRKTEGGSKKEGKMSGWLHKILGKFGSKVDPFQKLHIQLAEGELNAECAWAEDSGSWRVFCQLDVTCDFKPMIGIAGELPIPWGPFDWIRQGLSKVGVNAGLFVLPAGKFNCGGGVWYKYAPSNGGKQFGGKVYGEGVLSFGLKLGLEIGKDVVTAYVKGTVSASMKVEITMEAGPKVTGEITGQVGKLTAEAVLKLTIKVEIWGFGGSYEKEFKRETDFFDGFKLTPIPFTLLDKSTK